MLLMKIYVAETQYLSKVEFFFLMFSKDGTMLDKLALNVGINTRLTPPLDKINVPKNHYRKHHVFFIKNMRPYYD
jgi:hypothetical protein